MKYIQKIEEAKVLNQKDLLPTLDNQIVSTKLSDGDNFTFETYSFGKGQSITDGKAINQIFYYILKGSMKIGGEVLNAGDAILKDIDSEIGQVALEDSILYAITLKSDLRMQHFDYNKVVNLKENIQYVANSVTSNAIVQSNRLSMTLFSLAEGEGLSTHKAGGDAMVVALDGTVEIKIAEDPYTVNGGQLIILPYGIPHSLKAKNDYKMLLIVVTSQKNT